MADYQYLYEVLAYNSTGIGVQPYKYWCTTVQGIGVLCGLLVNRQNLLLLPTFCLTVFLDGLAGDVHLYFLVFVKEGRNLLGRWGMVVDALQIRTFHETEHADVSCGCRNGDLLKPRTCVEDTAAKALER